MKKIYQEFIKKLKDEKTNDLNKVFPKKEDLIDLLEELKNTKEYGLVWDKERELEDVVVECENKTPYLKYVKEKSVKEKGNSQNNILIEGDNYASLLALNQTHRGKVDVVYIDPPYNTGARDWKYNNDFVLKEDNYKHSKWLSMMEKRLLLAKDLLSEKGFICLAIDHYELFYLGCLCDSIFGEENRCGVVTVVHHPASRTNETYFATNNEFILVYAKGELSLLKNFPIDSKTIKSFNLQDEKGFYNLTNFMRSGEGMNARRKDRPKQFYPIYVSECLSKITLEKFDNSYEVYPVYNDIEWVWRYSRDGFSKLINANEIIAKNNNNRISLYKKRRLEEHKGHKARTTWVDNRYNATYHGAILLKTILKSKKFDYPKSLYAVLDFLKITSQKDSVILDFFAGSGTTGHATLQLNKEDKGKRKFILCTNNENNICEEVTYERIKKVIQGYKKNGNGEFIEGLGGRLEYYKIDFINKINVNSITENDKFRISRKIGVLLGLKEDCLDEVEFSKGRYQIFKNDKGKFTGIYFEENFDKMEEFREKLKGKKGVFYSYSGGMKKEYLMDGKEFERIRLVKIPTEFLNVYKDCIS